MAPQGLPSFQQCVNVNHIATLVRLFGLTQMPKSNEGTPIVGIA